MNRNRRSRPASRKKRREDRKERMKKKSKDRSKGKGRRFGISEEFMEEGLPITAITTMMSMLSIFPMIFYKNAVSNFNDILTYKNNNNTGIINYVQGPVCVSKFVVRTSGILKEIILIGDLHIELSPCTSIKPNMVTSFKMMDLIIKYNPDIDIDVLIEGSFSPDKEWSSIVDKLQLMNDDAGVVISSYGFSDIAKVYAWFYSRKYPTMKKFFVDVRKQHKYELSIMQLNTFLGRENSFMENIGAPSIKKVMDMIDTLTDTTTIFRDYKILTDDMDEEVKDKLTMFAMQKILERRERIKYITSTDPNLGIKTRYLIIRELFMLNSLYMDIYTISVMFRTNSSNCAIVYIGDVHRKSISQFLAYLDIVDKKECWTIDLDLEPGNTEWLYKITNTPNGQCIDIRQLGLPRLYIGNSRIPGREEIMMRGDFMALDNFYNLYNRYSKL